MARSDNARDKIDRVTPATLTFEQRTDELHLFVVLCGMRQGDPLRRQLVDQSNTNLGDMRASFLHLPYVFVATPTNTTFSPELTT